MPAPIPHHLASGIHRACFVQSSTPATSDVQDGVLWLDTSAGPPYVLRRWHQGAAAWRDVQMDSTGYPLPGGHRIDGFIPGAPVGTPAIALPDPGFEAGHGWTFRGYDASSSPDGLAASGGYLSASDPINAGGPAAYDGTMVGCLINAASMQTRFYCPQAGTWLLHYQEAYAGTSELPGDALGGAVLIDGVQVGRSGTLTPGLGTWNPKSEAVPFQLSRGWHTLELNQDDQSGGWYGSGDERHHMVQLYDGFYFEFVPGASPDEVVRVVHAVNGEVLALPLATLSGPSDTLVCLDPDTGLPAFCPAPTPVTSTYVAGVEPAGAPGGSTPADVACGAAHGMTNQMVRFYGISQTSAQIGIDIGGTLVTNALIDIAITAFTKGAAGTFMSVNGPLYAALKTVLSGVLGATVAGTFPGLDTLATNAITSAAYAALPHDRAPIVITPAVLAAWKANMGSISGFATSPQRAACQGLVDVLSRETWQQAANTGAGTPASDCS